MSVEQWPSLFASLLKARNAYTFLFCAKELLRRKFSTPRRQQYHLHRPLLRFKDATFLSYGDMFGLYKEIFTARYYHRSAKFMPGPGDIVFDVGAGEGFYTILTKRLCPQALIYAVEPYPPILPIMKYHFAINGIQDVTVIEAALFDQDGLGNYVFYEDYGNGFIVASDDEAFWRFRSELELIPVACVRLDSLAVQLGIDRIDLLKIDVEGAELRVLYGAGDFLKKISRIVLEYHGDERREDVYNFLKSNGFRRCEGVASRVARSIDYYVRVDLFPSQIRG